MAEEVIILTKRGDSLSDEHTIAAPDLFAKTDNQTASPTPAQATSATAETGDQITEPLPLPPAPEGFAQLFSPTELADFEIDVLEPPAAKHVTDDNLARSLEQKNPNERDTAPIRSEVVIQSLTQALEEDKIPDADRTGVDKLIKVLSLPTNKGRVSGERLHHLTALDFPALPKAALSAVSPAPPNVSPPAPMHATLAVVPPPAPPVKKTEAPAPPCPNPSTPFPPAPSHPAAITPSHITFPDRPEDDECERLGMTLTAPVGPSPKTARRPAQSRQFSTLRLLGLFAVILAGIVCVARFSGQKKEPTPTTRSVAFVPPPPPRHMAARASKAPVFSEAPAPKLAAQPAALPHPTEPKERIVYLYTITKRDRTNRENTLEALAERFGCDPQSLANNNATGADLNKPLPRGTTLWLPKNCPYDASQGLHSGTVLGYFVTADEAPLTLQTIAEKYGCHELSKLKRYLKANNPTVDPATIPSGTRVWLPSTLCPFESR